jgi:hypothetical protein
MMFISTIFATGARIYPDVIEIIFFLVINLLDKQYRLYITIKIT